MHGVKEWVDNKTEEAAIRGTNHLQRIDSFRVNRLLSDR